ncbi:MAG: hypothetical protein K2X93_27555 [Candidatus Obscuribacterales bacterium]|nr:hypothetical protein [Candidatus Obscuribacterales bacterium]
MSEDSDLSQVDRLEARSAISDSKNGAAPERLQPDLSGDWSNGNAVRCSNTELILPVRVLQSLDTLFNRVGVVDVYSKTVETDWLSGRDAETQSFEPHGWGRKTFTRADGLMAQP